MTGLALTLVVLSAVAHATWNFLFKRGSRQELFIWWTQVSIATLLLPVAVALVWREPVVYPGWWFVLGTAIAHALYFVLLGRGYRYGDLSVVYPIARGTGPSLVPILGALVLKEPFGTGRILRSCLIVLWLVLIALAP